MNTHGGGRSITITIDGEPYTFSDKHQEVVDLLRLAGVDPTQYDLAEVMRNGEPKVYRDEKVVNLRGGEAFVTVRQCAPVA